MTGSSKFKDKDIRTTRLTYVILAAFNFAFKMFHTLLFMHISDISHMVALLTLNK